MKNESAEEILAGVFKELEKTASAAAGDSDDDNPRTSKSHGSSRKKKKHKSRKEKKSSSSKKRGEKSSSSKKHKKHKHKKSSKESSKKSKKGKKKKKEAVEHADAVYPDNLEAENFDSPQIFELGKVIFELDPVQQKDYSDEQMNEDKPKETETVVKLLEKVEVIEKVNLAKEQHVVDTVLPTSSEKSDEDKEKEEEKSKKEHTINKATTTKRIVIGLSEQTKNILASCPSSGPVKPVLKLEDGEVLRSDHSIVNSDKDLSAADDLAGDSEGELSEDEALLQPQIQPKQHQHARKRSRDRTPTVAAKRPYRRKSGSPSTKEAPQFGPVVPPDRPRYRRDTRPRDRSPRRRFGRPFGRDDKPGAFFKDRREDDKLFARRRHDLSNRRSRDRQFSPRFRQERGYISASRDDRKPARRSSVSPSSRGRRRSPIDRPKAARRTRSPLSAPRSTTSRSPRKHVERVIKTRSRSPRDSVRRQSTVDQKIQSQSVKLAETPADHVLKREASHDDKSGASRHSSTHRSSRSGSYSTYSCSCSHSHSRTSSSRSRSPYSSRSPSHDRDSRSPSTSSRRRSVSPSLRPHRGHPSFRGDGRRGGGRRGGAATAGGRFSLVTRQRWTLTGGEEEVSCVKRPINAVQPAHRTDRSMSREKKSRNVVPKPKPTVGKWARSEKWRLQSPPTLAGNRAAKAAAAAAAAISDSAAAPPPPPGVHVAIDKKQLLDIARRNAQAMLQQGTLNQIRGMTTDEIARLKAGGTSVDDLVEYCKKLQKRQERAERRLKNGGVGGDSGDESDSSVGSKASKHAVHHPFALNPKPAAGSNIVFNVKNVTQLPVKTAGEGQLKLTFPVSSGQQHRTKESEWVPVSPPRPAPPPEKKRHPLPTPVPELPVVVDSVQAVASAPAPPTALPLPPPPAPPPIPPTPPIPELRAPVQPAHAAAVTATSGSETFNTEEPVDVGEIVTIRLKALNRLYKDAKDTEAIQMFHHAEEMMTKWAESKHVPGLFIGGTGAQCLTPAQLAPTDSKYQAWAKKDMFSNAKPVQSAVGMALLQKMGWKPGEGLGKNNAGALNPLELAFKNDRKGLVANEEKGRPTPSRLISASGPSAAASSYSKHPVSALMEMCGKRRWHPPSFTCVEQGHLHSKQFLYKVTINNVEYQPATPCGNKKNAKSQAAEVALNALGIMNPGCGGQWRI